jgi:hypothetical protein
VVAIALTVYMERSLRASNSASAGVANTASNAAAAR